MASTLTTGVEDGKQWKKIERNTRNRHYIEILCWLFFNGISKIARSFAPAQSLWGRPASDQASGSGLKRPDKDRRIDPCIIQADVPVHMRPGGATGGADFADHGAAGQLLADLHVNFRHVAEHADKALAMIDEHGVAIEEVVAAQDHLAGGWRLDRGACRHGEVQGRREGCAPHR